MRPARTVQAKPRKARGSRPLAGPRPHLSMLGRTGPCWRPPLLAQRGQIDLPRSPQEVVGPFHPRVPRLFAGEFSAPRRMPKEIAPTPLVQRRLPPLLRRAWYSLNQTFRQRIAHLGITPDQYSILRWLHEGDTRGLTQQSITDLMASDP